MSFSSSIPPSCFPSSSSPFTGPCYVAQTSFELLILLLQLLGGLRILLSLTLSHSVWTELAETFEAHFIMCSVRQVVKFSLKWRTTLYSFLVNDFEFGAQKALRWSVLLGKRFRELIIEREMIAWWEFWGEISLHGRVEDPSYKAQRKGESLCLMFEQVKSIGGFWSLDGRGKEEGLVFQGRNE